MVSTLFGTGLCGSWLVKRLLELEANVVSLVRDWPAGSELVQSGNVFSTTLVHGDVRDQTLMERVCGGRFAFATAKFAPPDR